MRSRNVILFNKARKGNLINGHGFRFEDFALVLAPPFLATPLLMGTPSLQHALIVLFWK